MTFISVFGRIIFKFLYSAAASLKAAIIPVDVGVPADPESALLVNQMVLSIYGILWISLINGLCSILWAQ